MTDNVTDLTPTILVEIRKSIATSEARLSAKLAETNARIDATNAQVVERTLETHALIAQSDARVVQAINMLSETMSVHWKEHDDWLRDHDVRIRDLERGGRRRPHRPRR